MHLLVKEKNSLLEAVHLATRKLSGVQDANTVLLDVLNICVEAAQAEGGTIFLHEAASKRLRFLHVLPEEVASKLGRLDIPDDFGVAGEAFQAGKTIISQFSTAGDPSSSEIKEKSGITVRTMITVPLRIAGAAPIGVVQLVNKIDGVFTEDDVAVLDTVGDVCAFAVTTSRLMEQRQSVAALEGMGRTAHDLANKAGVLITFLPEFERNLDGLRAVLKLQGVQGDAMFYLDMLEGTFKDVFSPYSERVYRYARLVNDLAAGKPLTPKAKMQSLPHVVEEAVQFMEPQSKRRKVKLSLDLHYSAPETEFDDLFLIRIIENLVGNAIKAVAETMPIEWTARYADDGDALYPGVTVKTSVTETSHLIEIIDNGPGLSPAQIRGILGGNARSVWSNSKGTGLGTKVVVELTQAMGAKLSIRSILGEGSTFSLEIPFSQPQLQAH